MCACLLRKWCFLWIALTLRNQTILDELILRNQTIIDEMVHHESIPQIRWNNDWFSFLILALIISLWGMMWWWINPLHSTNKIKKWVKRSWSNSFFKLFLLKPNTLRMFQCRCKCFKVDARINSILAGTPGRCRGLEFLSIGNRATWKHIYIYVQ